MAKKRGGLAGLYDRNKGVLQMLAPTVAGAFGGPLAGAAVGAAMRGLDRPGQRGIGLDVGQAIRGGAEGYGMGSLGQSARAGIGKMLAPGLPSVSAPSSIPMTNTMLPGRAAGAAGAAGGGGGGAGNFATRALDFATKYEKPLGMAAKGIMSQLPDPQEMRQQDFAERQYEDEQERRRRIAELLMPMYQQMMAGRQMPQGMG